MDFKDLAPKTSSLLDDSFRVSDAHLWSIERLGDYGRNWTASKLLLSYWAKHCSHQALRAEQLPLSKWLTYASDTVDQSESQYPRRPWQLSVSYLNNKGKKEVDGLISQQFNIILVKCVSYDESRRLRSARASE